MTDRCTCPSGDGSLRWPCPVHTPTDDEREAITDEGLWDFASDLLDAWNIEDLNPPSLIEDFRDRFVRRFRRSEVPEPSAEEDELAPGECDGSGKCAAERHIHGCYTPHRADQCDAPEEYGHLPSEPQGEPSDLVRRLVELRSDMRHNADEVATLDAAITALGAQGEPSDAQVEAAWAVLERDGLTVLERIHVRDALRAAGVLCEPSAPDGWFVFGSHAPYPWVGKMEFSAEQDEAGMPLWERPVQGEPSDAQVHAALSVYLDTDRAWADWETWQIESMRAALRAAGGAR